MKLMFIVATNVKLNASNVAGITILSKSTNQQNSLVFLLTRTSCFSLLTARYNVHIHQNITPTGNKANIRGTEGVNAIQLLNRKHEHYIDVHVLEQDKKPHFKLLIFLAGIKILSKTAN